MKPMASLRKSLVAITLASLATSALAQKYGGTLRFYGAAGDAKLVFRGGALARATIALKRASPRTRAYIEDESTAIGPHVR